MKLVAFSLHCKTNVAGRVRKQVKEELSGYRLKAKDCPELWPAVLRISNGLVKNVW